MASNELPDSRFLLPEMFSFSFDPEILTVLWGLCSRKTEENQIDYRYLLPKSSLLEVFVPFEGHHATFLNVLRYTVVTGGMIVVVGFSSYASFKCLQKLRYEGISGLKAAAIRFLDRLRRPTQFVTKRSLELVLSRRNGSKPVNSLNNDGIQRPSELFLQSRRSNATPTEEFLRNRLNGNNVPRNFLNVTPVNGEIASGDEEGADVQPQYFGPSGNNLEISSRRSPGGFIATPTPTPDPDTPDSSLRARYEALNAQTPKSTQQSTAPGS